MNEQDDLQEIWRSYPAHVRTREDELERLLTKRIRHFDRMIVTRNLIECGAGVFVAIFFARFGILSARNELQRAGTLIVAASVVWIIFYFFRYGKASAPPDSSRSLVDYSRALLDRYDHQIRFAKSIKYWYLLPPYAGLIIASAGVLLDRGKSGTLGWRDWGGPVFYTLVFLTIWWLNEIHAVGRLRKQRAMLLSIRNEGHPPAEN